jgi:hypothetical protein
MAQPSRHLLTARLIWPAAFCLLALWVFWYVDGFALFATVDAPGGFRRVVDTFAAVDHPFHATRAETLLQSLAGGESLRWVAHHQGGYPAEFYPLGIAWVEVVLVGLTLGALPIIAAHKLVVLLLFVLPAVAYWLFARGDRLSPAVAFLALCLHLAIPGDWTHGGYTELIGWGLVTNVGGAIAVLIAFAALSRYALHGGTWMFGIAAGMGAAAAYVNPRSLLGLAVAALAIGLTGFLPFHGQEHHRQPLRALGRLALAGGTALLLAAPVLVSLFRYRDLYRFLHYESYETLRAYWDASLLAVSPPVFAVAALGGGWALLSPRFPVARSVGLCLLGYAVMTVMLTDGGGQTGPIQQLETPRLMPFQRLLVMYLAAFGAVRLLDAVGRSVRQRWLAPIVGAVVGLLTLAATTMPLASVPLPYRAFAEVETTGNTEFAAFRDAVKAADAAASPGTSILVIGSRLSWHEQLWAPLDTDHPLYYDDWLWYWHSRHDGPYVYQQGHAYPEPADALTREYFQTHAVGAVVVTDRPFTADDEQAVAADQSDLTPVAQGAWSVYAVAQPVTLATVANEPANQIEVEPQRIDAVFDASDGGELVVRQNWFPRWEATINGQSVPVERRADGYMAIQVPTGRVALALTYGLTTVDWLARLVAVVGVVLVLIVVRLGRRLPDPHQDRGETTE